VDLDKLLHGDDDFEDDLDSMLLNPIASTISIWLTFKLLRRVYLLIRLVDFDEILYCNDVKGDLNDSKMAVCRPLITFEPLGKFS
jgi:hypothetical protein